VFRRPLVRSQRVAQLRHGIRMAFNHLSSWPRHWNARCASSFVSARWAADAPPR
jgi:hypothetical protein